MTFKETLQEKYKLVCEDTKEWQWPMVMNTYYVFTGNVSPDGESGEYKPKDNSSTRLWFNKRGQWSNNFGPAYTNSGVKHWAVNGKRHRLDGPATEFTNSNIKHYYINNVEYSKEDFDKKVKEIKGLQQAGKPYGVDLGDLEESTEGWPKRIEGWLRGFNFTGKVSPDGESGLYKLGNETRWLNKQQQFHNNFGPAMVHADGDKFWCVDGVFHRLDGPAVEHVDGRKFWFINGDQYSKKEFDKKIKEIKGLQQAGKPYGVDLNDLEESNEGWQWPGVWGKEKNYKFTGEVTPDGESGKYIWPEQNIVVWWNKQGKVHNDFGPAYTNTGLKEWLVKGVKHRLDGPAVEYSWAKEPEDNEYYIYGKKFSKEDYVKKVREMETLKKAGEPYDVDLNDL